MTSTDRRTRHVRSVLLGLALTALAAFAPAVAIAQEPPLPAERGVAYGGIVVECRDAQTGPVAQGDARFSSMTFSVENDSALPVMVQGRSYGPGQEVCRLTTDEHGRASTEDDLLPAGDYRVRLVDANPTMTVNAPEQVARIRLQGQMVALSGGASFRTQVARGSFAAKVACTEGGTAAFPGLSSADGARFAVENRSEGDVVVSGARVAPGDIACYLTASSGEVATEGDVLPVGRYAIVQADAGTGCLPPDGTAYEFAVAADGEAAGLGGDCAFPFTPIRGDLCFTAAASPSSRKAFVPFALVSETTGEVHILVTDENGFASTQASWNPHGRDTNAADVLLDGRDSLGVVEAQVDRMWAKAGCWFGKLPSGLVAEADEEKGALPYDRYTLQELPTAGSGQEGLIRMEGIAIARHGALVSLGTLQGPDRTLAVAPADANGMQDNAALPATARALPSSESAGDAHVGTERTPSALQGADDQASGTGNGAGDNEQERPENEEIPNVAAGDSQGSPAASEGGADAREALDREALGGDAVLSYRTASVSERDAEPEQADAQKSASGPQKLAKTSDGALPASAPLLLAASGSIMAIASSRRRRAGAIAAGPRLPRIAQGLAAAAVAAVCAALLLASPTQAFAAVTTVRDAPQGVPPSEIVFDYDRTLSSLSPSLTVSAGSAISTRIDLVSPNWKVYRACWSGSVDGTVNVPGTVSYQLRDVGFDLDGDRIDLRIDVSNITVSHRRAGTLSHTFCISELWVNEKTGAWDFYLTGYCLSDDEQYYAAGSRNMTVRAFKKGTNNPANGRFVSQFVDLDISDLKLVDGEPVTDYSGPFTEQVQLLSGYDETVHLSRDCTLDIDNATATFRATAVDENTLKSGFVAILDGRGFTLHWKGRNCGTGMLALYGSAVITAKAGAGGTITSPGETVVGWKHSKTYEAEAKPGYELADLKVDGASVGPRPTYTFENVQADHVIEALFAPIGYRVAFDANGGQGAMEDQSMTFDKKARLRSCAFSRPGYDFAGWNTAAPGGALGFDDEQEVVNLASTKDAVVTLYAQWVEKEAVPIQYNCGDPDHGSVDTAMEMLAPATGSAEGSCAFALTGYHVKEWRDRSGVVVGSDDRFCPTREPDELWQASRYVAIIEPNAYRVAYHPDGGSGAMEDSWLRYDEESTLAPNRFSRPGWRMVGWTDEEGTVYADEEAVLNLTDEDGGIVDLYALWEEEPPDEPEPPAEPDEPVTPDEPNEPAAPDEPAAPAPVGPEEPEEPAQPPTQEPQPPKPAEPAEPQQPSDAAPPTTNPEPEPPAPNPPAAPLAKTQDDKLAGLAAAAVAAALSLAVAVGAAKRHRSQRLRRQRALYALKRANEVLGPQTR
ncbi:InlB B-repeat-containing protein [Adlercreutzia aquisgranensis]|nr:InlB B-repeat-containing protein [Adlercreutzia aquisgranensis]